jgi:thymidylate synthase (FAD)
MNVQVLESTNAAEELVCTAARGDYMDDWNGAKSFEEIMSSTSYDERDMERAVENNHYPEMSDELEAKLCSFIEKQLSRGHYGPWENPQITFTVEGVSRVTMAQITRHRHMTFDVQSQRYVDFSDTEAIVPKSLTDPDHFSREDGTLDVSEEMQELWKNQYKQSTEASISVYREMVNEGIPKEDARFVLPLGTPVNMTFSGNARTFMHVFNLRQKASSQWEIRELCNLLAEHLKEWMPYSFGWYEQNKPHKIGP